MQKTYFILKDKTPTPVDSHIEWAEWYQTSQERIVKETWIRGIHIATVFIGISGVVFSSDLFMTVINGGPDHEKYINSSTYKEAEENHEKMVAKVKNLIN